MIDTLQLNKIYFLQHPDQGVIFIKPIEIIQNWDGKRWIHYFGSNQLGRIESIPDVDTCTELMVKVYAGFNSNHKIKHSDLSKPFTQEERDNLPTYEDIFTCWQDMIDGDYNGDIELWMKSRKLYIRYDEPLDKYGIPLFVKKQMVDYAFDKSEILLTIDIVKREYPFLLVNFSNRTIAIGVNRKSKEFRNITIGELLKD